MTSSGFRPDQEAMISEQYLGPDRPSIRALATAWRCSTERIRAALNATDTPILPKGVHAGPRGGWNPTDETRAANAARRDAVARLRAEGRTVAEIMAELGMGRTVVFKILKEQRGPREETTDARIIELRVQGWTVPAICKELRIGSRRAAQVLDAADVSAPPRRVERPSPKTRAVLAMVQLGTHTATEIVSALGVSRALVNRVARKHGIALPRRRKGAAATKLPMKPRAQPAPPTTTRPKAQSCRPTTTTRPVRDVTPHNPTPTMITTRTCHECTITMKESEWPTHMAKVHGVVSKNQKQLSAVDRYLERTRQEALTEPVRVEAPPCSICRGTCVTPQSHGPINRARAQHAAREAGKKEAA